MKNRTSAGRFIFMERKVPGDIKYIFFLTPQTLKYVQMSCDH